MPDLIQLVSNVAVSLQTQDQGVVTDAINYVDYGLMIGTAGALLFTLIGVGFRLKNREEVKNTYRELNIPYGNRD